MWRDLAPRMAVEVPQAWPGSFSSLAWNRVTFAQVIAPGLDLPLPRWSRMCSVPLRYCGRPGTACGRVLRGVSGVSLAALMPSRSGPSSEGARSAGDSARRAEDWKRGTSSPPAAPATSAVAVPSLNGAVDMYGEVPNDWMAAWSAHLCAYRFQWLSLTGPDLRDASRPPAPVRATNAKNTAGLVGLLLWTIHAHRRTIDNARIVR